MRSMQWLGWLMRHGHSRFSEIWNYQHHHARIHYIINRERESSALASLLIINAVLCACFCMTMYLNIFLRILLQLKCFKKHFVSSTESATILEILQFSRRTDTTSKEFIEADNFLSNLLVYFLPTYANLKLSFWHAGIVFLMLWYERSLLDYPMHILYL